MEIHELAETNAFVPFSLVIDIQSKEELISLWHIFNMPSSEIEKFQEDHPFFKEVNEKVGNYIFNFLNKKLEYETSRKN